MVCEFAHYPVKSIHRISLMFRQPQIPVAFRDKVVCFHSECHKSARYSDLYFGWPDNYVCSAPEYIQGIQ